MCDVWWAAGAQDERTYRESCTIAAIEGRFNGLRTRPLTQWNLTITADYLERAPRTSHDDAEIDKLPRNFIHLPTLSQAGISGEIPSCRLTFIPRQLLFLNSTLRRKRWSIDASRKGRDISDKKVQKECNTYLRKRLL